MLVIRLQRVGKKNQASFRVVLQEKTWSPKGKAKELLGFYNPVTKEKAFQKERINYWISKGAQPSPTVHNMFVDESIVEGKKVKAWQPKKKDTPADEAGKPAETASPAEQTEGTPQQEQSKGESDVKQDQAPQEDSPAEAKEVANDESTTAAEEPKEEKAEEPAPPAEVKKEE